MLTVLCWFWKQPRGRTGYTAHHVNIWAAMVRANLSMPHRIACVTKETEGLDPSIEIINPPGDFEDARIATWGEHLPQCLRRLAMFRPDASEIFGDRFVCMDIDSIISGPLDPLFEKGGDFRIYRGTSRSRPYNGSMMMLTAGARPQVYTEFTVDRAAEAGRKFIGSDQAWISHILGKGEKVWNELDGVFWWPRARTFAEHKRRIVFFPGVLKPWDILKREAWAMSHYRMPAKHGRCLILGYAPSVWADAARALAQGPVAAVIASPEAAEHWPGPVLEIARCDEEAEGIAAMHGFDDVVFCGRTREAA